jgi:G:T-mismatch repair DNA endonuclease (very short patch repair protein)
MAWKGGCLADPAAEAERRRKIAETLKGHSVSAYIRQAVSRANKGRKATPEMIKKRKESWTPERRREQSLRYLGKPRLNLRGKKLSKERIEQMSRARKGILWTTEQRERLSALYKEKWKDPVYATKRIQQLHSGIGKGHRKPNKPERALEKLLQKLYPGDYRYVGNSKFWVERFNPDFINCNGQKKIIEVFGDYWHNRSDLKARDKRRLATYQKYGYSTLVLWEKEIYTGQAIDKVKKFHEEVLK